MSDLGVEKKQVCDNLPNVLFADICDCHITIVDFPHNFKHIIGYSACKDFVSKNLV